MNPFSQTKKIFALILILVIVAIGLCYVMFSLIKNKVHQASLLEIQAEDQLKYQDRNRDLKNIVKDSTDDVARLQTRIITADGTVPFIENIESQAREAGLKVSTESVNVTDVDDFKDTYENLNLSINVDGTWSDMYRYLTLIEAMPYKLTLSRVSVTNQGTVTVPAENASSTPQRRSSWHGAFFISVLKHK